MARPKGSKDTKPRALNPASLANLGITQTIPGHQSKSIRIYAPAGTVRRFNGLSPLERGSVVSKGLEGAE